MFSPQLVRLAALNLKSCFVECLIRAFPQSLIISRVAHTIFYSESFILPLYTRCMRLLLPEKLMWNWFFPTLAAFTVNPSKPHPQPTTHRSPQNISIGFIYKFFEKDSTYSTTASRCSADSQVSFFFHWNSVCFYIFLVFNHLFVYLYPYSFGFCNIECVYSCSAFLYSVY